MHVNSETMIDLTPTNIQHKHSTRNIVADPYDYFLADLRERNWKTGMKVYKSLISSIPRMQFWSVIRHVTFYKTKRTDSFLVQGKYLSEHCDSV